MTLRTPLCVATLLLCALLGRSPVAAGDDLQLVEDGASEYEIVLPSDPSAVEQFAASELQEYLQKMSGAQLPITRGEAPARSILIGVEGAQQRGVSLAEERLGWDGFVMQTEGNQLVLAGRQQRGTLYAVYALLEELGVRWYAPNFSFYRGAQGGEDVPQRSSLSLESMKRTERPDYKYRKKYVEEGYTFTPERTTKLIDWMAKTRMNVLVYPTDYRNRGTTVWDDVRDELTPELEKRGMVLEVGGHGYQNYLSPEKYFDEHPAWFAMKDGERTRNEHYVFNTTNEQALDTLTANVIEYLRARPEIDIFDLWPPDQVRWSQDPQSLAQGDPADRQAIVINHVAEAVQEALPDVKVEFIAYSASLRPPDEHDIDAENTIMDYADYSRSFEYPIWDHRHPENAMFKNVLKEWFRSGAFDGEISYYTYYRKYIWRSLPVVFPRLMQEEMQYYRQLGVVGMGSYAEPGDWFTYELTHYAIANLSWNKDLNMSALVEDYTRGRFGPAAPQLQRYFWLIEETMRKGARIPQTEVQDLDEMEHYLKNMEQCAALLEEARTAAQGEPEVLSLLDKLELSLEYATLDLQIRAMNLRMSEEYVSESGRRLQALRQEMMTLFNENLDEGVFIRRGRYYDEARSEGEGSAE
jgi:hypothetical protein